jgi:hypothetical protein
MGGANLPEAPPIAPTIGGPTIGGPTGAPAGTPTAVGPTSSGLKGSTAGAVVGAIPEVAFVSAYYLAVLIGAVAMGGASALGVAVPMAINMVSGKRREIASGSGDQPRYVTPYRPPPFDPSLHPSDPDRIRESRVRRFQPSVQTNGGAPTQIPDDGGHAPTLPYAENQGSSSFWRMLGFGRYKKREEPIGFSESDEPSPPQPAGIVNISHVHAATPGHVHMAADGEPMMFATLGALQQAGMSLPQFQGANGMVEGFEAERARALAVLTGVHDEDEASSRRSSLLSATASELRAQLADTSTHPQRIQQNASAMASFIIGSGSSAPSTVQYDDGGVVVVPSRSSSRKSSIVSVASSGPVARAPVSINSSSVSSKRSSNAQPVSINSSSSASSRISSASNITGRR